MYNDELNNLNGADSDEYDAAMNSYAKDESIFAQQQKKQRTNAARKVTKDLIYKQRMPENFQDYTTEDLAVFIRIIETGRFTKYSPNILPTNLTGASLAEQDLQFYTNTLGIPRSDATILFEIVQDLTNADDQIFEAQFDDLDDYGFGSGLGSGLASPTDGYGSANNYLFPDHGFGRSDTFDRHWTYQQSNTFHTLESLNTPRSNNNKSHNIETGSVVSALSGQNAQENKAAKKKAAFDQRNNFYRSLVDDAAMRTADIQILQFNIKEKYEIAQLSDLNISKQNDSGQKEVLFEQIASYYHDSNKALLIQMFGVLASHVGICDEDDWNELIGIAKESVEAEPELIQMSNGSDTLTNPNNNNTKKHEAHTLSSLLGPDRDSEDDLGINYTSGYGDIYDDNNGDLVDEFGNNIVQDNNDLEDELDERLVGHKFEDQFTMYNIETMVDDFGALIDQESGKLTHDGAIQVVKDLRGVNYVRTDDDCVIYFEGLTWDDFEKLMRRCPHGIWMRVINPFDFEYAIQEIRKHVQRHVTPEKLEKLLEELGAEFVVPDLIEHSITECGLKPNPTIDLEFWFRQVLYHGKQNGACENVVNELMNISSKYSKDSELFDSDDDDDDILSKPDFHTRSSTVTTGNNSVVIQGTSSLITTRPPSITTMQELCTQLAEFGANGTMGFRWIKSSKFEASSILNDRYNVDCCRLNQTFNQVKKKRMEKLRIQQLNNGMDPPPLEDDDNDDNKDINNNNNINNEDLINGWCADPDQPYLMDPTDRESAVHYMYVDLGGTNYTVFAIAIQGDGDKDDKNGGGYVTNATVEISTDGEQWEKLGLKAPLGCANSTDICVRVFDLWRVAKYVKVIIHEYHGRPVLRWDLFYGVYRPHTAMFG